MKLAKEMGQPKKKAYVETTVISKFTVLSTYDSTLAGRQRAPDVLRFARRIKQEIAATTRNGSRMTIT